MNNLENSENIIIFRDAKILELEAKALSDIELLTHKEFKLYEKIEWGTVSMGFAIEDNRVTALGLYNVGLNSLPESIGVLIMLKLLDLRYNKLTSLPDSFTNLKSLQILGLAGNKISALPNAIGKLKSLKGLYLFNNELTSLPNSFWNLKALEILYLNTNQLTKIPDSITQLINLRELYLGRNYLNELPTSIWKLKNLIRLSLPTNPWKDDWIEVSKRDPASVLEYCRQTAPINIYLSHSRTDTNDLQIERITKYLEQQKEISNAFSRKIDWPSGNYNYLEKLISSCQLFLYFATKSSVFRSKDCEQELKIANMFKLQIIPIKGIDLDWRELSRVGLSRMLGFEFNKNNFDGFCSNLYSYIKQFKQDINLFDPEDGKIDRIVLFLKTYLRSKEFSDLIRDCTEEFEKFLQKLSEKKTSPIDFLSKTTHYLLKKVHI